MYIELETKVHNHKVRRNETPVTYDLCTNVPVPNLLTTFRLLLSIVSLMWKLYWALSTRRRPSPWLWYLADLRFQLYIYIIYILYKTSECTYRVCCYHSWPSLCDHLWGIDIHDSRANQQNGSPLVRDKTWNLIVATKCNLLLKMQ